MFIPWRLGAPRWSAAFSAIALVLGASPVVWSAPAPRTVAPAPEPLAAEAPPPGSSPAAYEIHVRAPRERPGLVHLGRADADVEALHLGEQLLDVPGVSAIRRGAGATEPVVRGFRGERVRTQVGVVPILAACPSNMDPPVTYLAPHGLGDVFVVKGLSEVAHGPAGLGGQIVVDPDFERPVGAPDEIHGFVGGLFESARIGGRGEAGLSGGTDWLDARVTAGGGAFGDYESGDGTDVPARAASAGASLNLGFRPGEGHRIWHALRYAREMDVDFPSLPMDMQYSELWLYNGGYRVDGLSDVVERLEVTGGLGWIDHLMDNAGKPDRTKVESETPSSAHTAAGAVRLVLVPAEGLRVTTGVDVEWSGRDATRTRHLVATDETFEDHLWPDVSQLDAGAYVDVALALPHDLALSAAARGDIVRSAAAAAGDPSLGGKTVAEQWTRFYGAGTDPDRTEGLGAARAVLEWRPVAPLAVHAGGAFAMRAASATERYFAFGPAPGGFQVGDPGLAAEKKWQVDVGVALRYPRLAVELSGFVAGVHDYILEEGIARLDVNGDGAEDVVRGFRNVSARFVGVEARITARPWRFLALPVALAWVRGDNLTGDRPLPLVPPLEGRAAVRLELGTTVRWWVEIGTHFAAPQDEVDPDFPENASDGWVTLDAQAGVELFDALRIEAGARNLIGSAYHEHLTRESPLGGGDLAPGDEVPAPGRAFFASARYTF